MSDHSQHKDETAAEQAVARIFAPARRAQFSPPGILTQRVLARSRDAAPERRVWGFWKIYAAFSSVAVVALAGVLFFRAETAQQAHPAVVNGLIAVRIDPQEFRETPVAYAEILLPDSVEFYSQKHPALKLKRSLIVDWEKVADLNSFPIVLRGTEAGAKTVRIVFYGADQKVVTERSMKFLFKKGEPRA